MTPTEMAAEAVLDVAVQEARQHYFDLLRKGITQTNGAAAPGVGFVNLGEGATLRVRYDGQTSYAYWRPFGVASLSREAALALLVGMLLYPAAEAPA